MSTITLESQKRWGGWNKWSGWKTSLIINNCGCVSQPISTINKMKQILSPFPSMLDGITDSKSNKWGRGVSNKDAMGWILFTKNLQVWRYTSIQVSRVEK